MVSPPYFYDGFLPQRMPPWDAEDLETGLIVEPNAEGTVVLWRAWRSGTLPRAISRFRFSLLLEAHDETTWYRFARARSLAQPVWFIAGMRPVESFDVADGETIALSRPRASDVGVGSVDEGVHPTVFYIDGEPDTAPGTWDDAQNFTVSGYDGLLQIAYTPAFRVIVAAMPESVPRFNQVDSNIILEEVTQIP